MFTPTGSAERPMLSAVAATALVLPAMSAFAYYRFANRSLAFALIFGGVCAIGFFYVVLQRLRAVAAEQNLSAPPSRVHVRRYSWFAVLVILIAVALLIASAIYGTWSLVVPALI